jgi:hypothetical protein
MYYLTMRWFLIVCLMLAAAACTGSFPAAAPAHPGSAAPTPSSSAGSHPSPPPSPSPLLDALHQCPATIAKGTAPNSRYGSRRLRTVLWPHGLVLVPPDDIGPNGWLGMKFPWWRGRGVRGLLHITGHEITSGAMTRARTNGYGLTGFNASSILFPSEGCYRITSQAGNARLTFVTMVLACSSFADLPHGVRKTYSSGNRVTICA